MGSDQPAAALAGDERIERHQAIDRWFHWISAVSVLILLATGLLPVVGMRFAWVTIHWLVGLVLLAATLFHLVRALFWQHFGAMWIGWQDVRAATGAAGPLAGKYTLAQKLMHHAWALVVLTAVVTGVAMLAKVTTPFWQRNPYLLSAEAWGVLYVLHDLAALVAVTLVMVHVYFALLPEKRMYLRAIVRGWVTREEQLTVHDPARWVQ